MSPHTPLYFDRAEDQRKYEELSKWFKKKVDEKRDERRRYGYEA